MQEMQKRLSAIDGQIVELYQKRMRLTEELVGKRLMEGGKIFGYRQVGRLDFHGARVLFQGVEGAYSQQAMQTFFGADIKSGHVGTWRDAMEAIAAKEADYAVLPIENSSAGIVSENYDLLVEYDNSIIGEQIIKIEHCLLGLCDARLSDITDVYSHAQALAQCSAYLGARPDWQTHGTRNTAGAAKKVKEDGVKGRAAIASKITKDIYGLKVLEEGIQNNASNSTRFIIVTGERVFSKGAGKISICFEIPRANESGSLYRTLSHLIYNNLNMKKIESRPIQGRPWEYRFFIDFEGSLTDGAVQNALQGLWGVTVNLKILGNY